MLKTEANGLVTLRNHWHMMMRSRWHFLPLVLSRHFVAGHSDLSKLDGKISSVQISFFSTSRMYLWHQALNLCLSTQTSLRSICMPLPLVLNVSDICESALAMSRTPTWISQNKSYRHSTSDVSGSTFR
jgi:hypothetical protein